MISPAQMRAARAILNVSQTIVANEIGIAPNTLSDIETGKARNVSASRLESIQNYYERNGIEFTEDDGAKRRGKGMMLYEGRDGFAQFRLDVIAEAKKGKADICVSNVDERLFDKWGEGEINDHYRSTMAAIKNVRFRILVKDNDNYFPAKGHAEYRWLKEHQFGDFPFYIFGSKTAIIPFEEDDLTIFILDHPKITRFYRSLFDGLWEEANIINEE